MPIGFNSAARNLFLLGSSGADLVTNFFKRIDQSAGTDGVYLPDEIRYNVPDQKFLLAGSAEDSNSKGFGWFEKRTQGGSADWNIKIQSTQSDSVQNLTLKALQIDNNDNLIVCGKVGVIPWIAKYTNGGNILWQVSSITGSLEYTGIAVDSNDNIYACGSTSTDAFIEKIDGTGSYSWGKYSSNTAGAITFLKCAANDRGEVVAVGKIEDTIKDKGYIAKVDTATGDLLWDRTIEDPRLGQSSSYWQAECTDVYIDGNDQIYVVGNSFDVIAGTSKGFIIKYTAEGNIIWQKETPSDKIITFVNVKSDTETEQTVVFGTYVNNSGDEYGMLSKYSKDGSLVWRRVLYTAFDTFLSNVNLDADPSFYYLLFVDQEINSLSGTPDTYVFGKVSTSGNGLGNFDYTDGISTVYYETSSIVDSIGRLSDGSVRQDNSDLITYPFGANKILFDDLATQVANKKVQVAEAGTYTNGTSPVVTANPLISNDDIVYGSNLLINYDFANKATYFGTGTTVNTITGFFYPGTVNGATFNSAGYFDFDGTNDYISLGSQSYTGGPSFSIEFWINFDVLASGAFYTVFSFGGYVPGGMLLQRKGDGVNSWRFAFNGSITYDTPTAFTSTSSWKHIVATVSGTIPQLLYINNVSEAFSGSGTPTLSNPQTFDIGRRTDTNNQFVNGKIGEFRLYTKVLSASEISQNFNATRSKYGV